jgi:hypothetical protein
MPRVFVYIITSVYAHYHVKKSCVPWVAEGKVFLGPCKKYMRPKVEEGDYIMGISPAGRERRVLLWMRVDKLMTFAEAYERGDTDRLFRLARGNAIHVRPREVGEHVRRNPDAYEHIPRAMHPDNWRTDIRGDRDVFISGANGSWVADEEPPVVTQDLVDLLPKEKGGGVPTIQNPLTRNARGRHVCLTGDTACRVIEWVSEPGKRVFSFPPKDDIVTAIAPASN